MAVRSIYQHVSLELVLSSGQGRSCLKAPCAACLFVQYRAAPEDPYARILRAAAALQRVCAVVTCALGSAARPAHNALYRYAADGWRTAPCRPKRLAFRGFLGLLFWICGSGAEPLTAPSCTGTVRFNGPMSVHALNTRQCALQHCSTAY